MEALTRAAVHRLAADGYKWHVATCRQTVEALIRAAVHRLAADGYKWHVATCRQTVEALLLRPSFNHRTHRTHGNKSSHRYVLVPCIRCVLWFPALRRQERVCGRCSAVSSGRQHCDGLEELEPTDRNDATPATRRSLGLATIVPFCNASRGASQPANGTATRVPRWDGFAKTGNEESSPLFSCNWLVSSSFRNCFEISRPKTPARS